MTDEQGQVDKDEYRFSVDHQMTHFTVQVPIELLDEYTEAVKFLAPFYNDRDLVKKYSLDGSTYMQDLSRLFFDNTFSDLFDEEILNDDDD